MPSTGRLRRTGAASLPSCRLPALPRWHVPRRHLVDLVRPDASVVCLVAGAGWGKSVLLRELVQRALDRGDTVAWLDLPAQGADRSRFWFEVAGALGASSPDLDSVVPTLHERTTGGRGVTLVLDDVHHLSDPDVREDVRDLVHRLPPGVQLAVATRFPLAWLSDAVSPAHDVVRLGRSDLRHTIDEVRALMTGDALEPLPQGEVSGEVAAVMDATEGWPALVRLHALAAGRGPRGNDAGRTRQIVRQTVEAYVLEQVLGTLPAELRAFLLDVSVLDVLTLAGCEAVAGLWSAGPLLDQLAASGVPLEPFGDGGLRLHRAVRTVAEAELARRDRAHWLDVHRRAAAHLIGAGSPLDAVDHLLEVSDHVAAVEVLVGTHRSSALVSPRRLASRMAELPVGFARSNPRVALDVALLELRSGRFASAARTVATLRQVELVGDLVSDRTTAELAIGGILGDIDRLIAIHASTDGDPGAEPNAGGAREVVADAPLDAAVRLPASADPGASAALRADAWPAAPIALLLADRFEDCEASCRRAEQTGSTHFAAPITNLGARAFLSAWRGRLREAAPAVDAARGHPAARELSAALAACRLASAELLLRLEADDPGAVAEDAFRLLADLAAECERHTTLDVPIAVIALRAFRFADEPSRAFDGSVPHVTSTPAIARPWLTSLIAEELVRCACDLGDASGIVAAERALAQVRGPLATALARAHVLVARHETAAARSVLAPLDVRHVARDSPARAIDLGVLQHRTATTSRELAGALDDARVVADQHGLRRSLEAMLDRGSRSSRRPSSEVCDVLPDPLSSRELDVLRLLPTDLPTAELAAQLFVSVNTVKTHMKSIYRKLGAAGRIDAVRRARDLGVLPRV